MYQSTEEIHQNSKIQLNKSQRMTEDPLLRTHIEGFLVLLASCIKQHFLFFLFFFLRPDRNYSTQIRSWDLKLTAGADTISMKISLNGRWLLAYPWRCTTLSM